MKLLILDHLRRWWLVWLAIGIANCLMAGWALNNSRDFFLPYVMFVFWLGAFQLNYDMQRGHSRVLTALPVTPKQVGRAWWVVTVGLPALFLAATSALGLLLNFTGSTSGFPARNYFSACIIITLLLGAVFYMVVGGLRGWPQNPAEYVRMILSWVFFIGIFSMRGLTLDTPYGFALLLITGALTVAGFFQAEQFVLRSAGLRPINRSAKTSPGRFKAEAGFGGLPYLVARAFIRCLLIGLYMTVVMVVMFVVMQHSSEKVDLSLRIQKSIASMDYNYMIFWFSLFQLAPTILHLRFLRTLPLSTITLAITLVLIPVAAILCLGGILVLLRGIGTASLTAFSNYLLIASFGALGLSALVWRGVSQSSLFLVVLIMMPGIILPMLFLQQPCPFWLKLSGAICLLALAIELTRRALIHSHHTYRVQTNPLGGGWGGGWGASR